MDYGRTYNVSLWFPRAETREDTNIWKLVINRMDREPVATLGFINVPDWTYPVKFVELEGGRYEYEWFGIYLPYRVKWELVDRCAIRNGKLVDS